jgi:hypothetical protein
MPACLVETRDKRLVSGRPVVVLPRVPAAMAVSVVADSQAEWNVNGDASKQSRRSRVRWCDDHSP